MKFNLSLFIKTACIVALSTSCKETQVEKKEIRVESNINLDSANKVWNDSWNSQNIDAIGKLIAENAVVFMYEWKLTGKDSIIKNWIQVAAPSLRNLKTDLFKNETASQMAFSSGYYSYDVMKGDSVVATDKGAYSIVWKKQSDNSIKMEALQFSAPK